MRAQALLTQESAFAQSARLLSPTVGLVSGCIAILVRLKSGWPARHESSAGTHSNTLSQNPRPRHRARRHRLVRGIPLAIGVLLGLFVLLSDGVSAQPPQAAAEVGDGYLEWRSGQFSIVAQFVAIEGENVILHRRDNHQRITVPLKVLDAASQQQARDCHQASLNPMEDSGTKPVEPKSTPTRTGPSELQEVPIPANTIITGLRQSRPVQRLLALYEEKLDLPEIGSQITYEAVIRNNGKERRTYFLQWQKDGEGEGEIREIVVGPNSEVAVELTTTFDGPKLPVMGFAVVDDDYKEVLGNTVQSQVTLRLYSASIRILVEQNVAKLVEARMGMSVYDWINEQFRLQTELFNNSKSSEYPDGCPLTVLPGRIDVLTGTALQKVVDQSGRAKEPFIVFDLRYLGTQSESSSTVAPSEGLFRAIQTHLGFFPLACPALRVQYVAKGAPNTIPALVAPYMPPEERRATDPLTDAQVKWINIRMQGPGDVREQRSRREVARLIRSGEYKMSPKVENKFLLINLGAIDLVPNFFSW